MIDRDTGEVVELLQALIRNVCVNLGTTESGEERRNAETLAAYLGAGGLDVASYHHADTPDRPSLVVRIAGSDPDAPSMALVGHTDVVPVSEEGWSRDPFGGELIEGEVWGRGAVDMLNQTASMAVAVRRLAEAGFRPKGTLYLPRAARRGGRQHLRREAPHRRARRRHSDRLHAH